MAAPAAYATEATKRHGAEPWWYVTIGGVGHRADADGRPPTKFSTYSPEASYSTLADFRDFLESWPRYSSDVLNLEDGSSDPGTCEFTIVDRDDITAPLFAYLSTGKSATGTAGNFPITLAAAVTRNGTTMDVLPTGAALTVGTMVFLDSEAVRVKAISAGTGIGGGDRITIARAQWNTHNTKHYGGDHVRSSSIELRGQLVEVYRNFVGKPSTDEYLRWRGVVTSVTQTPEGMGWRVQAQSLSALLAGEVCRHLGRFTAKATPPEDRQSLVDVISVTAPDDDLEEFPDTEQEIWIGSDGFKGAIRVRKLVAGAASGVRHPTGLQGLSATGNDDPGDYAALSLADRAKVNEAMRKGCTIWQVFPPGQDLSDASNYFPKDDPFSIWLTFVLSRDGDDTISADYDKLPTGNGLDRIQAAWVDITAFERLRDLMSIELPNHIYGAKGESFSLKEHAEKELLGPYGVIVAMVDGVLTPILTTMHPLWWEATTSISHDDIAAATLPMTEPDLRDAIEHATAQTGYDHATGEFRVRQEAHLRKREKWLPGYGRTAEWELHGYRPNVARSLVKQLLTAHVQKFGQAPGRITLDLPDTLEHILQPGSTVLVTSDHMVALETGLRGVTDYGTIVTGIESDGARLSVSFATVQGVSRVASIAPAIRIDNVVSTTVFEAELDPVREFTTATASGGFDDYDVDDDWFRAGAAATGDAVSIVNGNDLTVRTTGHRIDTLALVGGRWRFTLSTASAPAVVGDYITFDEYDAGGTTTRQKSWAYVSNNSRLGTSNDSPYTVVA